MIAVGIDDANLMSGKDAGCIKLIKKQYSQLIYTVCFVHWLNLCINSAVKAPGAIDCCTLIEKIVSFFKWPKRASLFEKILDKMRIEKLKLIDPSPTRQIQRLEAINRLKKLYPAVVASLIECYNWPYSNTSQSAVKLVQNVQQKILYCQWSQ